MSPGATWFTCRSDIKTPRFSAANKPVRLTWDDNGDITVHVGALMFEKAMRRVLTTVRGGQRVVALFVVPVMNKKSETMGFFENRDAAPDAFYFWLNQIEAVYCDNDDCILLPDGRQVDLQ